MQEISTGPFDDSPAGFRLLYKHGRSNTSQWTRIKNREEFIDSLTSFFIATEPQIAHELQEYKIEKDLSDVVTGIINHIKTNEFLESAFQRMAQAHKTRLIENPLENIEQIEKKPWVYTSGGTMNTLVSCYYRIEDKPKVIEKWVESEMELLVFFAETLKQIPSKFLDVYIKGKRQSILMHSPTHVFLLNPTLSPFKETWLHEEFAYTYIRDRFVRPNEIFIEQLLLNDDMIQYLLNLLIEKIPENYQPRFRSIFSNIQGPLNPIFFREFIVNKLQNDRGLRQGTYSILTTEEIDSLLYATLPLFSIYDLRDRIQKIFSYFPNFTPEKTDEILKIFDGIPLSREKHHVLGSQELQGICKALLCLYEGNTSTPIDYHLQISQVAKQLGYSLPPPIIFGDTNWVKDMFGFLVNPGTGKFELWRLDYTGSVGYPMLSWKQWVNGSRPNSKWGIYIKPIEYGQF